MVAPVDKGKSFSTLKAPHGVSIRYKIMSFGDENTSKRGVNAFSFFDDSTLIEMIPRSEMVLLGRHSLDLFEVRMKDKH